jgi:hypothetical protein
MNGEATSKEHQDTEHQITKINRQADVLDQIPPAPTRVRYFGWKPSRLRPHLRNKT